jgi:hypothetical protein
MDRQTLIERLTEQVSGQVRTYLKEQTPSQCASVQCIDELALELARAAYEAVFETWAHLVDELAVHWGRPCPECGKPRKCRWRKEEPMNVGLLLGTLRLGKPYLSCGTPDCSAPGLSVVRLLTGLSSGDSTPVLKLEAARQAAEASYGKSQRALEDHPLGRELERTKLRRLAVEVEGEAIAFAESLRQQACEELGQEGLREGVDLLVLEGDGGKVRVGELHPLEPGQPGYGETTPVRGLAKRRRETTFREVITLDVRELGEVEASALDVMVPVRAAEGERSRRMLALAGRKGLGDNTEMYGLGDMGSGLASAFDEAFFSYRAFWAADRKHTWDYVYDAASILEGLDANSWAEHMRQAVLDRDERRRDALLEQAKAHRVARLPDKYERCPLHALHTYLHNNWKHMRFREMEQRNLPTVSARAEAQVRDRTKDRFSVAGAWNVENIEGKATLRSIIDEGSYGQFVQWYWRQQEHAFCRDLKLRLDKAVEENRVTAAAAALLLDPSVTVADILSQPGSEQQTDLAA